MLQEADALHYKRKNAASTQELCAEIIALTKKLPDDQAKTIINGALDTLRANIKSDLESHVSSLFIWDNLPGEVKNEIYKRLLISDQPIRPAVLHRGSRANRVRSSHSIQGQLLVLSKEIYEETLPILLGDNTFFLNADLLRYLGFGLDRTMTQLSNGVGITALDRAIMVRRIVVSTSTSITQMGTLTRFKALEELIITHPPSRKQPIANINNQDWEKETILSPDKISWPLVKYLWHHPKLLVYYVGYQQFEDLELVSTSS